MRKHSITNTRIKFIDSPSTQATTRKSSHTRTRRIQTEHVEVTPFEPTKRRNKEQFLPQTHSQYVKAKQDVEYAFQMQKRRNKMKPNQLPFDLKMAFIIQNQSETGRKILHKSSFESSPYTPYARSKLESIKEDSFKLQPIKQEIHLEQESLGQAILHQDWDKRWESLFETFFEMQALKTKDLQQVDGPRKLSRVTYKKGSVMKTEQIIKQITTEDIIILKKELWKPSQFRDILSLDVIFEKNKFLMRFNEMIRKIIIMQCKYREFNSDEMVLSSEYNHDKVYVILQGSCKVVMTSFSKNGETLGTMSIRSIYEGYPINVDNLLIEKKISDIKQMTHLGEANLQQYVKSEIYAQEKTFLIELSKEIYDNLLTQAIDQEMKEKIELLKKVKILGLNRDLKPLAAILQLHKFKFGDLIIAAGQEIKHLYFIKSGRVKVTICTREIRELYNYFSKSNQTELYDYQEDFSLQNTKNIDHCGKVLIEQKNGKPLMEMNIHVDIKILEVGDFFGGSSLMTVQEILGNNRYKTDRKARVSLIALTPVVELYSIDSMEFETLPDGFQHQLKELLLTQSEFDDVNFEQYLKRHEQWSILKQAYYKSFAK